MSPKVMNEQVYRERECIHRAVVSAGKFYGGHTYIKYLQRLRGKEATDFANRVTPFFWSDAGEIVVWLCDNCAAQLGVAATASAST